MKSLRGLTIVGRDGVSTKTVEMAPASSASAPSNTQNQAAPATDAKSWGSRNCGGATSISVGCDDCCLTHVVARCGPREADTIGIRPVLPLAWKWQRIRNMCRDRCAPQIGNVHRQHENARTANYADDKGGQHFLTQSHFYLPLPTNLAQQHCDRPSILRC
jgi:hypothetical protein